MNLSTHPLKTAHIILASAIVLLAGCDLFEREVDAPVAATVSDKQLLVSDVEMAIPENVTGQDSINMAQSYVRNWVTENLLLEKAELNLTEEQLNVSQKMEEYRRSLLIYLYQKEYVLQQMDTSISNVELKEYYETNKKNFKLANNIARLLFVRLDANSKDVDKVVRLCKSDKEEDMNELNSYCQQHAISFLVNTGQWMAFKEVLSEIPDELYGTSHSLFKIGTVELSDSTGHYILSIKETKARNEVSPLEFESSSIRGIILNKRKIDLVRSLEQQIFDEGLKKNHVQIN